MDMKTLIVSAENIYIYISEVIFDLEISHWNESRANHWRSWIEDHHILQIERESRSFRHLVVIEYHDHLSSIRRDYIKITIKIIDVHSQLGIFFSLFLFFKKSRTRSSTSSTSGSIWVVTYAYEKSRSILMIKNFWIWRTDILKFRDHHFRLFYDLLNFFLTFYIRWHTNLRSKNIYTIHYWFTLESKSSLPLVKWFDELSWSLTILWKLRCLYSFMNSLLYDIHTEPPQNYSCIQSYFYYYHACLTFIDFSYYLRIPWSLQ